VKNKINRKRKAKRHSLRVAAVGLEAELSLFVDERPEKPEDIFGTPRTFVRGRLHHRKGTSFQLPTGAAVYFDTGVIELATPPIELERGCMSRAGRLLWESIAFIRRELDAWEQRTGHVVRLAGFSTHYNVSIDAAAQEPARLNDLAKLLTYVLPPPAMLLAANPESNGIGVRPRGDRIEVTADFTPRPALMVAAGSLITGVVREIVSWPSLTVDALDRKNLPRIRGFTPMPHTSRKGWLARHDRFPANPMANDPAAPMWCLSGRTEKASLRAIGMEIFNHFRQPIARIADPFSLRVIRAVLAGRERSLLDLPERPCEYEDVGRACSWRPAYSRFSPERSRLEQIVLHALAGDKLWIDGVSYAPTGMQGWSRIMFRRGSDGKQIGFALDDLLDHLSSWRQTA
jgi:hypothetical protein